MRTWRPRPLDDGGAGKTRAHNAQAGIFWQPKVWEARGRARRPARSGGSRRPERASNLLTADADFAITLHLERMSAFLNKAILCGALAVWAAAPGTRAQEPQRLHAGPILGNAATPFLRFDASSPYTNALKQVVPVTNVQISGTWNA